MKQIILLASLMWSIVSVSAQVTLDQIAQDPNCALTNYSVYRGGTTKQTPAPKGYKPFYVTHYARHGSRYLISNGAYHRLIPLMEKAEKDDQLTDLGKSLLGKLRIAYAACHGKSGKLSILGGEQHEQIATRMFHNFPEAFQAGSFIDGYSSPSDRAIQSMNHFCLAMQKLNSQLQITKQEPKEYVYITRPNHDTIASTPAQAAVQKRATAMEDSIRHTLNISAKIFKNPKYVTENNYKHYAVAYDFYDVFKEMYSLPELNMDFNVFTPEQLFAYYKMSNINWMERTYLIPGEAPFYKRAYALLNNMIAWADEVIQKGTSGASVRFGHDTYVMPLAYVLGIEGCTNFPANDWENSYKYFDATKIVPMASNVQLVFFKKKGSKDVLVKFLLQEEEKHIPVKTDIWPYYHWKDVKAYYKDYMYKKNPIEYIKDKQLKKSQVDETNT